jgi:hypothetical protein
MKKLKPISATGVPVDDAHDGGTTAMRLAPRTVAAF